MSVRSFFLAAALFCCTTLSAQRDLEYVTDATNSIEYRNYESYTGAVALSGSRVFMASFHTPFLLEFRDNIGAIRHYYPIVNGERLVFLHEYFNNNYKQIAVYNSQVYMVLTRRFWGIDGFDQGLYRFDGANFHRLVIPGIVVSNPVVFGSYLYFISRTGDGIAQLYRYDGTTITAVSTGYGSELLNYLVAAGDYLYVFKGWHSGYVFDISRYDGTGFTAFPDLGYVGNVERIYPVGSTTYIWADGVLGYYDGTTVSDIGDIPSSLDSRLISWRNSIYVFCSEDRIYRKTAGVVSEIPLPAGSALTLQSVPVLHNDALYIPVSYGPGDNRVLRYDGTGFTEYYTLPPGTGPVLRLYSREGDLVIHRGSAGGLAYEHDGSTVTEIRLPPAHTFGYYLTSTDCHHLWISKYDDADGHPQIALLKESKGCPPPPPPPPPTSPPPIPDYFLDLEMVEFIVSGKDRGWCFNEIILDWIVKPCSFPDPCPAPAFRMSAFDSDKKPAWQKNFDKPSVLKVPLKDDQPYSFTLSSAGETPKDVLQFAGNLVEKGIESIGLSMKPGDDHFKMTVTTDKFTTVPLRVELLGKKDEVLWQKDFMAPFSELISGKVKEPGQTLRFSVPGTQSQPVITQLHISPNPSKRQLNLQIKSGNVIADAELSITTLLGQKILDRKIKVPFNQSISLDNTRPGMYVLKIVTGKEVVSRIIRME